MAFLEEVRVDLSLAELFNMNLLKAKVLPNFEWTWLVFFFLDFFSFFDF